MKQALLAPEQGRVVAGKYRLVRVLGRGGMGMVFEAQHVQVRRSFALKFLRQDRVVAPRSLRRFEREAELLGRLDHENIVGLLDIGVDEASGPYLVLEYVRGITLRRDIEQHGRRPLGRVLSIVRQIGRGLAHAHALGIVHRDLKPENVMLSENASGELLVKLLDFGVARLRDESIEHVTLSDVAVGTAEYMAPEQARGDRSLDARTDVYALGVIVYEMLSNRRPYRGESYNETLFKILHREHQPLAELRPELPEALVNSVERALCKDPAQRFPDVEAFVAQVEASLPNSEITAREGLTQTDDERVTSFARGRPASRRRGGALGLLLGAGLGYAAAVLNDERGSSSRVSESAPSAVSVTVSAGSEAAPAAPGAPPPRSNSRDVGVDIQATAQLDPERSDSTAGAETSSVPRGRAARRAPSLGVIPSPMDAEREAAPAEPPDLSTRGYITYNPYGASSAEREAQR